MNKTIATACYVIGITSQFVPRRQFMNVRFCCGIRLFISVVDAPYI